MATDPRTIINDTEDATLNPSGDRSVVPASNANATLQTVTVQYNTPPYYGVQDLQIINDPGGNTDGVIQFNASNRFGGDNNLRWDNKHKTLNVLGNIRITGDLQGRIYTSTGKFKLYGGNANNVLSTDGNGNLTWIDIGNATYGNSNVANFIANYSGNLTGSNITITDTAYLYNISSTGTTTVTNFSIVPTGSANLGTVSNITITGGSNGQFLTTDGAGHLSWTSVSSISNLFANTITFGDNTVQNTAWTGTVNVSNVTGLGNISTISLDGNASNILYGNGVFASAPNVSLSGDGGNLSNINGANVTGAVSYANTANSVAVANVTGIGNIATINYDGNASNILYGNGIFAAVPTLSGDGGNLSNINGANVIGAVNYANTSNSVAIANVTGIGNIAVINLDGNANHILYGNGVFAAIPNVGLSGDGGNLSNINGANVSGAVSYATTANSVAVANVTGIGNIATTNYDGNASNVLHGDGTWSADVTNYSNSNVTSLLASFGSNTITTTGNVTVGNIIGNGQALTGINGSNVTGQVSYAAVANSVAAANVSGLGNVALINKDGNASNVLYGNGVFAAKPSTSPAGSNTQIQFNDSNAFGATANLVFDKSTNTLDVNGPVVAGNGTQLGGLTNPVISGTGNVDNYLQVDNWNASNTANASADFIAYPNNGTDASGWIDVGITSNAFSQAAFSVTTQNEGYVFMSAPSGSGRSGNLVLATDSTGANNSIEFYVGGFNQTKNGTTRKLLLTTTGAIVQVIKHH